MGDQRAKRRRVTESRHTADPQLILLVAAILNLLTAIVNLIRELIKR